MGPLGQALRQTYPRSYVVLYQGTRTCRERPRREGQEERSLNGFLLIGMTDEQLLSCPGRSINLYKYKMRAFEAKWMSRSERHTYLPCAIYQSFKIRQQAVLNDIGCRAAERLSVIS